MNNLHTFWQRHRRWLLPSLVILMAIAAATKLGMEFHRLLWNTGPTGAIDLKQLHHWVGDWFSGRIRPFYYPPATYVLLWPLVGWISFAAARWLWAITSILAMGATICLMWRVTDPKTQWEKWFVALLLLSLNGTGVTIGNGQVILHILPALVACVLVLERGGGGLIEDFVAAALMTWALMKPSVSAPFFWVVLFGWKRWRPALLVVAMYSILTLVAAAVRGTRWWEAGEAFLKTGSGAAASFAGTRNIHALLLALGLTEWIGAASMILLAVLGIWIFWNRRADPWILMGVAGLVARMWTYHRVYDDVLMVLPEIALFRIATRDPSPAQRTIAGVLVGLMAIAMLCLASFLEEPSPTAWIWTGSHVLLWLIVLGYLMYSARREKDRAPTPSL